MNANPIVELLTHCVNYQKGVNMDKHELFIYVLSEKATCKDFLQVVNHDFRDISVVRYFRTTAVNTKKRGKK